MTGVPRLVADRAVWVVDDRVSVLRAIVVGRAVDVHGAPIPGARIRCARPGAEVSAPGADFLMLPRFLSMIFSMCFCTGSSIKDSLQGSVFCMTSWSASFRRSGSGLTLPMSPK